MNNYLFDIYRDGKLVGAIRATGARMACLNYALLRPGVTSEELEARIREVTA